MSIALVNLVICEHLDSCSTMASPVLLAEKDGIAVWTIENFLSDYECDFLVHHGIIDLDEGLFAFSFYPQLVAAPDETPTDTPLVCFDALSTLWWYTHPHGRRHRFVEGTLCVNESTSRALLEPNPRNGRQMTYSSSQAFYPGEMVPFTEVFEQKAAAAAALLPPDVGKLLGERRGGKYQVELQDLCCGRCFLW